MSPADVLLSDGLHVVGHTLLTVTQVVSGVPTVTEKVRCDETWVPDRIIFQFPDFMAEKGMPLAQSQLAILFWTAFFLTRSM